MVEDKEHTRKRGHLKLDDGPPGEIRPSRLCRHVSPPSRRYDDSEGHYVFNLGEDLTPKYKILRKMGEGKFGQVLECWDRQAREYVAIKVVRSIQKYRDAAMIEIDVLKQLATNDKRVGSHSHCVQILNWFDYRNHICIVFERLGPSLFDLMERNKYSPIPLYLVRDFGRQLLESVAYMHDLRLIHTDLKPENILLVYNDFRCLLPKSSAIKLIDFGSTAYGNRNHRSVVTTRQYRAPEVILGLGWSYPCDIWSVGCILFELYSGQILFPTHGDLEHLAMMERVLGVHLPESMIPEAAADRRGAKKYFRRSRRLNWPEGADSGKSIRAVGKLDCLENMLSQYLGSCSRTLSSLFIDLLHDLLKFDPSERLTAREALEHPFFTWDVNLRKSN